MSVALSRAGRLADQLDMRNIVLRGLVVILGVVVLIGYMAITMAEHTALAIAPRQ